MAVLRAKHLQQSIDLLWGTTPRAGEPDSFGVRFIEELKDVFGPMLHFVDLRFDDSFARGDVEIREFQFLIFMFQPYALTLHRHWTDRHFDRDNGQECRQGREG